jgi:hypothetical protein
MAESSNGRQIVLKNLNISPVLLPLIKQVFARGRLAARHSKLIRGKVEP